VPARPCSAQRPQRIRCTTRRAPPRARGRPALLVSLRCFLAFALAPSHACAPPRQRQNVPGRRAMLPSLSVRIASREHAHQPRAPHAAHGRRTSTPSLHTHPLSPSARMQRCRASAAAGRRGETRQGRGTPSQARRQPLAMPSQRAAGSTQRRPPSGSALRSGTRMTKQRVCVPRQPLPCQAPLERTRRARHRSGSSAPPQGLVSVLPPAPVLLCSCAAQAC
jgi:hypothetical protein